MSDYQTFAVQQHVDVTVAHLLDIKVLDPERIQLLREELLRLADEREPKKLVINFGGVTSCSSEFIGALIVIWKRIVAEGGLVRLCGMNENIREVFRLTKLEGRVFDIYDSAPDAMRDF